MRFFFLLIVTIVQKKKEKKNLIAPSYLNPAKEKINLNPLLLKQTSSFFNHTENYVRKVKSNQVINTKKKNVINQ